MKVLITCDAYKSDASPILRLKKELEERGAEVRVLAPSGGKEAYREGDVYYVSASDVTPSLMRRWRRKFLPGDMGQMLSWAPDILHSEATDGLFELADELGDKLSVPVVVAPLEAGQSLYDTYKKAMDERQARVAEDKEREAKSRWMNIATAVITLLMALATFYGYKAGYFTNINELQSLVATLGLWGPLVFVFLQILQVVFPIIPGGLGMLAGVILFGPAWGFVYNYLGIVAGSLIAFGISKAYGEKFVKGIFPRAMTERYFKWVSKRKRFRTWFAAAIFFPIAPDDLLCYIAGTTKMGWRDYTAIIVLGKPASIALYSLGLNTIFTRLLPIG